MSSVQLKEAKTKLECQLMADAIKSFADCDATGFISAADLKHMLHVFDPDSKLNAGGALPHAHLLDSNAIRAESIERPHQHQDRQNEIEEIVQMGRDITTNNQQDSIDYMALVSEVMKLSSSSNRYGNDKQLYPLSNLHGKR